MYGYWNILVRVWFNNIKYFPNILIILFYIFQTNIIIYNLIHSSLNIRTSLYLVLETSRYYTISLFSPLSALKNPWGYASSFKCHCLPSLPHDSRRREISENLMWIFWNIQRRKPFFLYTLFYLSCAVTEHTALQRAGSKPLHAESFRRRPHAEQKHTMSSICESPVLYGIPKSGWNCPYIIPLDIFICQFPASWLLFYLISGIGYSSHRHDKLMIYINCQ